MEKQQQQHVDITATKLPPGNILANAHSILFVGICSTGGGHTEREFNVVRALLARSLKGNDPKALNCLNKGSAVIVILPPDWPVQSGNYFNSARVFIQELRDSKLGLHVFVFRGTKTATSLYDATGGRPAILRLHARFPFDDTKAQVINFDHELVAQQKSNDKLKGLAADKLKDGFREFRDSCPKIRMAHLVPQVIAAAKGDVKKIWGSTDMDFALTRALQKAKVPGEQIVDHESIMNVFIENPQAAQSLVEYCYFGKVLPSKNLSKTAHIPFSSLELDILNQPNTLISLSKMVASLPAVFPKTFGTQPKDVLATRLRFYSWKMILDTGRELSLDDLAKAGGSTAGIVYGSAAIKKLAIEKVKGLIYVYLSDNTLPVAKHIAEQLKAGKVKAAYEQMVFVFCNAGALDLTKLGEDKFGLMRIEQVGNVMLHCNLIGGDGVMQAGMGTSSEFAYSVAGGCTDSRLLCWPMQGQDEHASNARLMQKLFPKNVTLIDGKSCCVELDKLVQHRAANGMKPYEPRYLDAILSRNTIATSAAAALLDDPALEKDVEIALEVLSNPDLRATYRLVKICVQVLDQLEGPAKPKGAASGDGGYPYKVKKPGELVVGLKHGVYKTFNDAKEAIKFFSRPEDIAAFLESKPEDFKTTYDQMTGIVQIVLEALHAQELPAEELRKVVAAHALLKVSDVIKTGV